MTYYAGIDVSLEASSICVVEASGKVVREGKAASEPAELIAWFADLELDLERIGLEAGPLSQWLHAGLTAAGLRVELLETRHVRSAFKTMPVKTDRTDARGIAQLMRLGWFRPVWCKSLSSQEMRALLAARRLMKDKLRSIELSLRGLLRNFGLKLGEVSAKAYESRVRTLTEGHPVLAALAEAMLGARAALRLQFAVLHRQVLAAARASQRTKLLMTAPGVGAVVALDYASAIDDPSRFASSRRVGAYFGLTQRRYQSGETDRTGRISRLGDKRVRASLYEAAHVILTRVTKPSSLRAWGQAQTGRLGPRKTKVALARRLAVILHHMLVDNAPFDPARGGPAITA
ncbi:MAG TPA: IS110 family transposase [Phenylobacterium sp.]|jgi:transposase|uniref:IS110 family transposase n=1 Tax=Phenylobacterium sp. TaxID=1871053 RepID=UPI002D38261E|nr:IS110 family transposase [Phenylobacterium sp.]HZZ67358.1 IS110 family transposase [Phenylobacterium sp.]